MRFRVRKPGGIAWVDVSIEPTDGHTVAFVDELGIQPGWVGMGATRELILGLEESARRSGAEAVVVEPGEGVQTSEQLWLELGYSRDPSGLLWKILDRPSWRVESEQESNMVPHHWNPDPPEERRYTIQRGVKFPPGTSPFVPPTSTGGAKGSQRQLLGRTYEIKPSGLVVPLTPERIKGPWVLPENRVPFDKTKYYVEDIPRSDVDEWARAEQFIIDQHYAHGLPNVRPEKTVFHGLYNVTEGLVGVALYVSQPGGHQETGSKGPSSIINVFPGGTDEALELSRFILKPDVGYNGETWFLKQSRDLLSGQGYRGFISFSDPHARITSEGEVVKPGHYGTIYQGGGLVYFGQRKGETYWFLPDWNVALHPRGESKIRKGESGWDSQVRRIMSYDSSIPAPRCLAIGVPDPKELGRWLDVWLPRIAHRIRVPGKHKFAFLTDPTKERQLRRLGRLAGSDLWSSEDVLLPEVSEEEKPHYSGISALGFMYPKKPVAPETGREITVPEWRRRRRPRLNPFLGY